MLPLQQIAGSYVVIEVVQEQQEGLFLNWIEHTICNQNESYHRVTTRLIPPTIIDQFQFTSANSLSFPTMFPMALAIHLSTQSNSLRESSHKFSPTYTILDRCLSNTGVLSASVRAF